MSCEQHEADLAASQERVKALETVLRDARQVIEWATQDAEQPLRASTIGKLYQTLHAIDALLAGGTP